jgi:ABC-type branched-subunit amino acid transport system permease subunit
VIVAGLHVTGPVLALGVITGMVYGILGVGLVLVYRSNRVVNFAHGDIGAFGAAFLGTMTVKHVLPYWLAFVVAIALSASIAVAADAVVIRRLRDAPILVSVIATLGLGQTLQILAGIVNSSVGSGVTYPQPPGLPTFDLGPLKVTRSYSAMLLITPIVVMALVWFLSRTRVGIALRASAANVDAARMAGVLTDRMSAIAWGTAGAMAAFTAILVLPTRGFSGGAFLGPGLLLRALVCGVVARMSNLTVTLAAGVGLGVVESVLLANYPSSGLVEAAMFVAIVVGLLLQRVDVGRAADKGTFAAVQAWDPLPESYQRVWLIRNAGRVLAALAMAVAIVLPALLTNDRTSLLIVIAIFTLVGLSVGVVTSLAGQLTLGQFALCGVGAVASYHVTRASGNFLVGVLAGALVAAAVSVVIGLPALRIRGLMLAVTTLAFALAMQMWGFNQRWTLGDGVVTRRPAIGSTTLTSTKQYYFVALAVLVVGLVLARNVWRSGFGRQLRAVRDNENAARAFTIAATRVKLQAFAVSGLLAGLGGAIYGHYLSRLAATAFPIEASINTAAIVVLGGMGVLLAPLLGALYIVGIPGFLPLDNAGLAATSAGWLALVVRYPGGIAQAAARARRKPTTSPTTSS